MPCKCPCIRKKSQEKEDLNEQLEKKYQQELEREQRIVENYRILREDLYEGIMKKYFATGQDYRQFARLFLDENIQDVKYKAKYDEPANKGKTFFQSYLLLVPDTSRFYDLWQLIMLAAYLVEFALVPYVLATGIAENLCIMKDVEKKTYGQFTTYCEDNKHTVKTIEIIIDICHVFNMLIIFITAIKGDIGWNSNWKEISIHYITSIVFYIDIITTYPMLCGGYYNYNVKWLYWFKVARLYEVKRTQNIVNRFVNKLLAYKFCKKMTINKIEYFINQIIGLSLIMHVLACGWLRIGEDNTGSWINNRASTIGEKATGFTKYVTSFYWIVTSLTTVGYGDVKGFTPIEYAYTLLVELVAVLFFSFVMGSINEIFLDNTTDVDFSDAKLESVDVWLVKLDNSRMSKQLPNVLYNKIRHYIRESMQHDHKKLVEGYDFLEQLKPNLRFKLITQLFKKPFLDDFKNLFVYGNMQCGKEFISYFTSQLYCRVFIANQTIIKKGEHFSELYLIFQGSVTLSLAKKDENEYFRLYATNHFGDYQILMNLRASECYKSTVDGPTYTFCLKKKELIELLVTFPDASKLFEERAKKRRIEFRRIKKQFEFEADVHPDPEEDARALREDVHRFACKEYTDKGDQQPQFLTNTDYYFMKPDEVTITKTMLEELSDSEVQSKQTQEEVDKRQQIKTMRALKQLENQMDTMNDVLVQVKSKLADNADKTVAFLTKINNGEERAQPPNIENLENCMHDLQVALSLKKAQQQ